MHDAFVMRICQPGAHGLHHGLCFLPGKAGDSFAQKRVERLPLKQFHRHEDQGILTVEVIYRDNVPLRQRMRLLGLPLQRLEGQRVSSELRRENLDRDLGVTVLRLLAAEITGAVDHPHATVSDKFLQDKAVLDYEPGFDGPADRRLASGRGDHGW
jgi:hypothetical protein